VRGYGIEIEDEKVIGRRERRERDPGHLEGGLAGFDSGSFDLRDPLAHAPAVRHTEEILREMLRVGARRSSRSELRLLAHRWQVIRGACRCPTSFLTSVRHAERHLCTIEDFEAFCNTHGVRILERLVLDEGAR